MSCLTTFKDKAIDELLIPDDHNRIILEPLADHEDCQGSFVNASHVDVRRELVCGQRLMCNVFFIADVGVFKTEQVYCYSR